ncbi:hypothetical protein [Halorhodospira halophila]|uniref:hypothetical protein n=1 Tax=Halorhodospira halophila TaxID=1053 RepID=UPI001912C0D6|nr:hypothetical protein [Halorhodospira halophila]MBK5942713.1 hypothetical protein [Halorhodospira halophila]
MVRWSDMLPGVMPHVPGAPKGTVKQQLQRAAERFFLESHAWVEELDPIPPEPDGVLFLYPPTSSAEVIAVSEAKQEGKLLEVTFRPPAEAVASDIDKDGDDVYVRAALKPASRSRGIPEEVWSHWGTYIQDGALARVMEIPGKPWSSFDGAEYFSNRFRRGVVEARSRRAKGHTEKNLRVQPRRFV